MAKKLVEQNGDVDNNGNALTLMITIIMVVAVIQPLLITCLKQQATSASETLGHPRLSKEAEE